MYENIKVIAMDLDGTLTQHKTPLSDAHRAILTRLSQKYKLLMAGAGQAMRVFRQMGAFPIDVVGSYGMQFGVYNPESRTLELQRNVIAPCDQERMIRQVNELREQFGFTEYAGDSVEFHASGCVTFPILGTKAKQEDKLAFDPDRAKRRKIYQQVVDAFPDYCVFVGGSSSFDLAPRPYNKFYALDLYCKENGYTHDEVVYIGDDYGLGGNDESVYKSDFGFICVDDYRKLEEYLAEIL